VRWGLKPTGIEELGDKVILSFPNGSSVTGDILVGADGINSQGIVQSICSSFADILLVRSFLIPDGGPLERVPTGIIAGETTVTKTFFEKQLELGHSAYVVDGEEAHLFVGLKSVVDGGLKAEYYWFLIWDDPNAASDSYWTSSASRVELYDFALKKTASMDPQLTEIMRITTTDGIITPPLVLRDMVLKSLPNTRITLLGDAAHPMTPCRSCQSNSKRFLITILVRGEGGSHAMQDALNLTRAIGRSTESDILVNLKSYQDEMLQRGVQAVEGSRNAPKVDFNGRRKAWGQVVREI
jgi:hypothetical protein